MSIHSFPGAQSPDSLETRIAYLEAQVALLTRVLLHGQATTLPASLETPVATQPAPAQPAPIPPESSLVPKGANALVDRLGLCGELMRWMFAMSDSAALGHPKFSPGNRQGKPRIHFAEDNSFLYFDEFGRIHAGKPNATSKGVLARRQLRILFQLGIHLVDEFPTLAAAIAKSSYPEEFSK